MLYSFEEKNAVATRFLVSNNGCCGFLRAHQVMLSVLVLVEQEAEALEAPSMLTSWHSGTCQDDQDGFNGTLMKKKEIQETPFGTCIAFFFLDPNSR